MLFRVDEWPLKLMISAHLNPHTVTYLHPLMITHLNPMTITHPNLLIITHLMF
jgi:hypothetical protein